jgi:hypothetical protein
MGSEAGLAKLSEILGVDDVGDTLWSMPFDVCAIDRLWQPVRRVRDSIHYIFVEYGLYIDQEDAGQHIGT